MIGRPSRHGEPVPIERALDHVFGVVLLNDWSARDIQAWETRRSARSWASRSRPRSATGWSAPARRCRAPAASRRTRRRCPICARSRGRSTSRSRSSSTAPSSPARTRDQLYWSVAQQIAHLTVNGASLRTGDLLGSGTISGPERDQRGSLLELSWNGEEPVALADGSTRTFLEDGDEVVLRGAGLGEVRGRVSAR